MTAKKTPVSNLVHWFARYGRDFGTPKDGREFRGTLDFAVCFIGAGLLLGLVGATVALATYIFSAFTAYPLFLIFSDNTAAFQKLNMLEILPWQLGSSAIVASVAAAAQYLASRKLRLSGRNLGEG